jgi:phosphotransferase system HPr (HPr) family protein
MNGETLERKVTITNPAGFHMRPHAAFAQLAQQFQAAITVIKDDLRVNGKSTFELLLMSVPQGTELTIQASGSDAQEALDALAKVLALPVPQEEPDPPLPQKG